MTTNSFRYDHPAYLVTQLMVLVGAAAASGTNCQIIAPIDFKLRNVRISVRTAGTTTTHAYTVRKGTTSLGAATLGSSAADYSVTTGDLNTTFAAGDVFNILKSDDATGVAAACLEIQFPAGTSLTV